MESKLTFNGLVWKSKNAWSGKVTELWWGDEAVGNMDYNVWMTEATVKMEHGEWIFTYNMNGEISVYDKKTGDEIALVESKMTFSSYTYWLRLRYFPDTHVRFETIKEKWWSYAWQWTNEEGEPMVRYATKFSFSNGYVTKVFTNPDIADENMDLYIALGVFILNYQRAAGTMAASM